MKKICRLVAAAILTLGAIPAARAANSFSNDVSDLWWNPNESGWGMNLIQQSNVAFATFFLYDNNGQAHWYVASDLEAANVPTDVRYVFRGRLYETTGPVFSAPSFASAAVTARDVGAVTFEFYPPDTGHVTMSVDGVTFDKDVSRQTWSPLDLTGRYYGGMFTAKSPFSPAAACTLKTGLQMFDDIEVTQSGTNVVMTASLGTPPQELCRYTGSLTQTGHMARVTGAYSCNSGTSGTFELRELEAGVTGLAGRYSASPAQCAVLEALYGNFSAIRTN